MLFRSGLLLRFLQTSAHVPGADAVLVALVLHRGELRGDTDTAGDPPVAAKGGEDGAQRPPLKAVAGDERRIA